MVGEGWTAVSEEGKTFLTQLLQVDPKRRLTADQALSHSWVCKDGPSLNRRLSSISGLAVIASKSRKKVADGIAGKGKRVMQSPHKASQETAGDVHYVDEINAEEG